MIKYFRFLLLSVFISIIFLTTACQSTPETEAVIGKGDNELEKKIAQSPVPKQECNVPAKWEENFNGLANDVLIEINANIDIPDVNAFPVVQVEPDEITQDEASNLIDGLIGDAPFIVGKSGFTKSEIQDYILEIQKSISDPNSDFNQVLKEGTPEYQETLKQKQAEISAWSEALKTAPDTIESKEASKQFQIVDIDGVDSYWSIEGYPQLANTEIAYLEISKSKSPFYLQNIIFFKNQPLTVFSTQVEGLNDVTISLEEAKDSAQSFLEKLGINDMKVSLSCSAYQDAFIKDTIEDAPQCYVFYFTRIVENLPITYQESRLDYVALAEQYSPFWEQESIRIGVDDSGIVYFYWGGTMKTEKILNSNIELLPFGEIQELFTKNIVKNIDIVNDNPAIVQRRFYINRIVLGLTKIMQKNKQGKYMLIPTWSFFGYEIDKYDEPQAGGYKLDENNEYRQDSIGRSFLTINAIDGSIIDPELGY